MSDTTGKAKAVAERVMRWRVDWEFPAADLVHSPSRRGVKHLYDAENRTAYLPDQWNPFDSAEDDYAVLSHVRKSWPFSRRQAFVNALSELWNSRSGLTAGNVEVWPNKAMRYEVGDYAESALACAPSPVAPPAGA